MFSSSFRKLFILIAIFAFASHAKFLQPGNRNTLAAGGSNNAQGAVGVFTRSNGVWAQQTKLRNIVAARQGFSVGLSADGNTIVGAARVFTRTGNRIIFAAARDINEANNRDWHAMGSCMPQ
jgi:hypothetical protein